MAQPGLSHKSSVRRLSMSASCFSGVKLSSVSATVNWSSTTVYVFVTTASSGLTGGKKSGGGRSGGDGGSGGVKGGESSSGNCGGSGGKRAAVVAREGWGGDQKVEKATAERAVEATTAAEEGVVGVRAAGGKAGAHL
eukprot:4701933-Prymnesium_polylepis.1